jgi:hypothetical protein
MIQLVVAHTCRPGLTNMHLVGEIELGERDRLEVVRHSEIENNVHWFLGNDSVSNLGYRIRPDGRRMNSPASHAVGDPRNVPILSVIRIGVPFHGVRVIVATRVGINIVRNICQCTDGLLELAASVAIPLGDGRIIDLIVGRAVEWVVVGIVRRQLQRLRHFTGRDRDIDLQGTRRPSAQAAGAFHLRDLPGPRSHRFPVQHGLGKCRR